MKIGIISDTHGSVIAWEQALELFRDVDLIVHAGDLLYHGPRNPLPESYEPKKLAALINDAPVPVIIARGNCDAEVDQMMVNWPLQAPYAFLQVDDLRLLVNHGHTMTSEQMLTQAQRHHANLFVCGHTHLPVLTKADGAVILNPGSPSLPKDELGTATVAVADDSRVRLMSLKTGQVLAEESLGPISRGRA